MKLSLLYTAALLFGAMLGIAYGNDEAGGRQPGGPRPGADGPAREHRPPATEIAKHVAAHYAVLAAFDTDKNGTLDESEQAAVAKAIDGGTLKLPRPGGPRGPRGGRPGPRPENR
jgi:hypothetical protein